MDETKRNRANQKGKSLSSKYDFMSIEAEIDENDMEHWDYYQKLCYNHVPPIPTLSVMKKLCDGTEYSANLKHYKVGSSLPIILKVLTRLKTTADLDLADNNLDEHCAEPLIDFLTSSEVISTLNLSDNPRIRGRAIAKIADCLEDNRTLELVNISNTGCQLIGKSVAKIITNCLILQTLDVSNCGLRQTCSDIALAIPQAERLLELDLSHNQLYVGAKRLAVQLGQNIAKSSTLQVVDLSSNALTSEQCASLCRGMASCSSLKSVNLQDNNIDEEGGRAIANFISKSASLKYLNISHNPILNVVINIIRLKRKLEEEKDKPGNKKDKKPKEPTPGVFFILNACAKSSSIQEVTMIGLVVDKAEYNKRVETVKATNRKVEFISSMPIAPGSSFFMKAKKDEE